MYYQYRVIQYFIFCRFQLLVINKKKILFVGIRNCYCVVCKRTKNIKKNIEEHNCFLNWSKGATSIKADTISEGYLKSVITWFKISH